jgi:hypothetical protein
MTRRFVVVYEAPADFQLATELADRVLREKIDWLEEHLLDTQRVWVKDESGTPFKWSSLRDWADRCGVRVHGHFGDQPGEPDAKMARRAIVLVRKVLGDVNAIVLVRDLDDQPNREIGLQQAVTHAGEGIPIVIGAANAERESWVLSGFFPATEAEENTLQQARQDLGFNPVEQPQLLTAVKNDQAKKSPKRILNLLIAGDRDREAACWRDTPLDRLRERGSGNGLRRYLLDVERCLVAQISGMPPERQP